MDKKTKILLETLKDERSKKVIFVSHCILNENVRYLGGAFTKGSIDEIIDKLQKQGIGIVQMKCPEQMVWGGVLKRYSLFAYGLKDSLPLVYAFRKPFISLFVWYTKMRYRRLAKGIASQIGDYEDSGFQVVGIIGIDGSPSCGVNNVLDFEKSFEYIATTSVKELDRNKMNSYLYSNCLVAGSGFFIEALKQELKKRKIKLKFYVHDLVRETAGKDAAFRV